MQNTSHKLTVCGPLTLPRLSVHGLALKQPGVCCARRFRTFGTDYRMRFVTPSRHETDKVHSLVAIDMLAMTYKRAC